MDQAGEMIVVYTTLPSESDARKIGAELIEARLAACVNIFPGMASIFRWQGAIETASEAVMLVKTAKSLEDKVMEAIAARHPYSVPALFTFKPQKTAAPFLEWVCSETSAHVPQFRSN